MHSINQEDHSHKENKLLTHEEEIEKQSKSTLTHRQELDQHKGNLASIDTTISDLLKRINQVKEDMSAMGGQQSTL